MSSPQPKIKVETRRVHTENKPLETNILFLSELLSKEVYSFLLEIGEKLHSQRFPIVTIYDIFFELSNHTEFSSRLDKLHKNILDLKEEMLLKRQKLVSKHSLTNKLFFSPDAKKLLLNAYQVAKSKNERQINLEHLWDTLFLQNEISEIVFNQNENQLPKEEVTQNSIEEINPNKVVNTYAEDISSISPIVASLTTDLSNKYRNNSARPMINRHNELQQIYRIIARKQKNSCLLLGENGVGKSTIVEGLAYELIYNQNLPALFAGYRVLSLNFSTLLASAEYPGSNVPKFMEELNKIGKVILFVNGIRFSDVSQEGFVLNTFLNLVFRNKEIAVIVAVEPSFYRSTLEKNELFIEHFEIVKVEEPSLDVLLKIIDKEALQIQKSTGITIPNNLYQEVIELSKRYLAGENFPQKALSLIQEASTATQFANKDVVTIEIIKKILSDRIGVPLQTISVSDREKLMQLESKLKEKVIGQDHAVDVVVEAIKRSRAGIKDQKKPIGSFLFIGPSGVGKTELAKQLALIYYNDEKAFVRLDMSEYGESHTSQRLIGAPPGYTGYEEGGQFTNPIQLKPYSLILLDEIEKAHPKIFDIFLQVIDEGRLTDSRGKLSDFRNAILIFTSNIGANIIFEDLSKPNSVFYSKPKEFYNEYLLPELLKNFRPEFINRFDEVITFKPLSVEDLVKIAKLKIKRIVDNLKEKNITLVTPDEELIKLVTVAYDPRFGARPIERLLKEKIETPLAQEIISGRLKNGSILNWKYTDG